MSKPITCPVCIEGKLSFVQTIDAHFPVTQLNGHDGNRGLGLHDLGDISHSDEHGYKTALRHFECTKCGRIDDLESQVADEYIARRFKQPSDTIHYFHFNRIPDQLLEKFDRGLKYINVRQVKGRGGGRSGCKIKPGPASVDGGWIPVEKYDVSEALKEVGFDKVMIET